MEKGIRRSIWGILLITFHVNVFGLPVFPKWMAAALWASGVTEMGKHPTACRTVWAGYGKKSGLAFSALCLGAALGEWLGWGGLLWETAMPGCLMLAEMACGLAFLNLRAAVFPAGTENAGEKAGQADRAESIGEKADREAGTAKRPLEPLPKDSPSKPAEPPLARGSRLYAGFLLAAVGCCMYGLVGGSRLGSILAGLLGIAGRILLISRAVEKGTEAACG